MEAKIDKTLGNQIVATVKDVCGHDVNFIDRFGRIFASTDEHRLGTFHEAGKKAADTKAMIKVEGHEQLTGSQKGVNLPIYHKNELIAVIGITGEPDEVQKYAYLAERITILLIREQELSAFSRTQAEKKHYLIDSLIKGEPVNPDYITESLCEFNLDKQDDVRLILVQVGSGTTSACTSDLNRKVEQLFERTSIRLFTMRYPNEYIALIKPDDYRAQVHNLEAFSRTHADYLRIAVGKISAIFQLADSYHSAVTAMKALTSRQESFAVFDQLTLEIILSCVDLNNKEEYFEKTVALLSEKDIELISVYFDSDMSLSVTSKLLFLHKNTLQYKLDRIYKKCGLNPRNFRDAVLLYLAVKLR